ncbi:NACHT domain-containing protein [Streptomyces mirabilis]|uniref:NACHT domain-containing protein n=1 Tax=Streptomyces mirabilis TaxID=68239 RepID=UPI003684E1CF
MSDQEAARRTDLAAELRALRDECGSPSLRELEKLINQRSGPPMARATIDEKFKGTSTVKPWQLIALVNALKQYAANINRPVPPERTDLAVWLGVSPGAKPPDGAAADRTVSTCVRTDTDTGAGTSAEIGGGSGDDDARLAAAVARGLAPLPGVDQDEPALVAQVRPLDARGAVVRRWLRLLLAASMLLRRRRARDRGDATRLRMLKLVRDTAGQIVADAETAYFLPPSFEVLRDPPLGKSRSAKKGQPFLAAPVEGATLHDLFERSGESLLLLGEAGLGKTTQLARLSRDLAGAALAEPERKTPIPILLSLASYRGEPLAEWLVRAIAETYDRVDGRLVRSWLDADLVLPVLDALDQVPTAHRRRCAEELSAFRRRTLGLVVSCRAEFVDLAREVDVPLRARLRPVEQEQAERYLAADLEAMADVKKALDDDPSLWSLLRSPLMLQVIHGAYAGRAAVALRLPDRTPAQRETLIFDAYVRRMLLDDRRPRTDPARSLRLLTWLAKALARRQEDVLHLDRLDQSWLAPKHGVFPRVVALASDSLLGAALTLPWVAAADALNVTGVRFADAAIPAFSGLIVITAQVVIGDAFNRHRPEASPWAAVRGNLPAIISSLTPLLLVDLSSPATLATILAWLWIQVTIGEGWFQPVLRPVEQLRWTGRPHSFRPAIALLMFAVLTGLCGRVFPLFLGRSAWLAAAAAFPIWLIYVLSGAFEPSLSEDRPRPNEGIRRSVRFAFLHGSVNALLIGGVTAGIGLLVAPRAPAVAIGLAAGYLGSLLGLTRALRYGGMAVIQHWTVRAVLIWTGATPARYQHYLDEAQQRVLLRRFGGGYVFLHEKLRTHLTEDPEKLLRRLNLDFPDAEPVPVPV